MDDSSVPVPDIDDDDAELRARAAAVAAARADRRGVPHEEMRAWLLKVAAGDLTAQAPEPRDL
jgi:hypothetical protein